MLEKHSRMECQRIDMDYEEILEDPSSREPKRLSRTSVLECTQDRINFSEAAKIHLWYLLDHREEDG